MGGPHPPPKKRSRIDCNLPIETNLWAKTGNDPMTHSFDLPLTLYQKRTRKVFFLSNVCFLCFIEKQLAHKS